MTTQKKTRATTTSKRSSTAARAAARPRRRARAQAPDHASIAERAYFIGLAGGADPVANWLRAEQELAAAA